MTRPEKRYFKLFAGRHLVGGKNTSLILFDVIAAESDHFNMRVNYVNALHDTQQLNANLLSLGRGVIDWLR